MDFKILRRKKWVTKLCQYPHFIYYWHVLNIFINFFRSFFYANFVYHSLFHKFSVSVLYFGIHQFHHLNGFRAIDISSISIFFFHARCCLYLLHQAISLTRLIIIIIIIIIISKSSSKSTQSRLTWKHKNKKPNATFLAFWNITEIFACQKFEQENCLIKAQAWKYQHGTI